MTRGRAAPKIHRMRQTTPIRRYALARSATTANARPDERVRRLRLVRMEAIAEAERRVQGVQRETPLLPEPHAGVGKSAATPAGSG